MTHPAVRLTDVTVAYRGADPGGGRDRVWVRALDEVSIVVRPGEIVAVCGRNGAGKTTLLDVVTGFRGSGMGTVSVFDGDPRRGTAAHRARVGVALADSGLPPNASVARVLGYARAMHANPLPAADLLDRLGLTHLARRRVRRLSTGERQRLAIACALVGRPELLVLDEPTSALDVEGRRTVLDLLRAARDEGAAVLWTSHTLTDVSRAGDRVVVLDRGRVLADGPPADLAGAADIVRFEAAPACDTAPLRAALPLRLAIREASPGRYEVVGEQVDAAVLATVSTWQAANSGTGRLSVGPRDLEDVLVSLTTSRGRA